MSSEKRNETNGRLIGAAAGLKRYGLWPAVALALVLVTVLGSPIVFAQGGYPEPAAANRAEVVLLIDELESELIP